MAKRIPQSRRQGSPSSSTKLPIFTLSGGVSRQAESKRLPTEAQNMDNALISLERSFEKRPGFEIVTQNGFTGDISYTNTIEATISRNGTICTITRTNNVPHALKIGDKVTITFDNPSTLGSGTYIVQSVTSTTAFTVITTSGSTGSTCTYLITDNVQFSQRPDLFPLEHSLGTTKDYWFYWFNINENNRFLLVIDYKASAATDVLIYVFRIKPDGTWSNETNYSNAPINTQQNTTTINADTRAYITYGNETNNARDVLRATTIGNSIIILNTLVKAGFSSPDTATSYLYNLDGSSTTTTDTKGRKITYYTSARYTQGNNNHWYLNALAGDSRTISGTVAVGNTVTLSAAPTLPSGLTNGDPVVINSIIPSNGSYAGGISIKLTGTNFDGATAVTVGGTACTSVNVIDSYTLTCVTPALAGGTYSVMITTPNGSYTLANGFIVVGSAISATYTRNSGSTVTVTSNGHGLITGNMVNVDFLTGGAADGLYQMVNATSNTFTFTTVASGTITTSNCTYYAAKSVVTSITPNTGVTSGGTTITILGSGFSSVGVFTVKIGTGIVATADYTLVSDSQITVKTPNGQGTGLKDLVITHDTIPILGSTITNAFTYQDSVPTTVTTNPSSKNKFYVFQNASNWAVLSGWTSLGIGTSYTVESLTGTIANQSAVTVYSGYFPEVDDFIWHDVADPWLGQSMADFSEIRFPPELAEQKGNNGIIFNGTYYDRKAKDMLAALYPTSGDTTGQSKIYYASAPYLNFTNGYYRVISAASKPYTKKIRSPDAFSVLDERRMPQRILFDAGAGTPWTANPVAWEPRTSGDRYSNPGPSVFLSTDKTTPVNRSINAITTFRDRLYMAAEDVVFTSQLGSYEDLFISDPSNIVATDPIDIRALSNTFSEITSLTPFNTYLFINTLGNVQYELKGTQNAITPLTAEISPTAFYGTSKFLEPLLLGSLIYFLDSSKLYLYFSSETTSLAVAQELTVTCADYLPSSMRQVCTAPSQNCIAMIDNTNQNHIYFHMSRFAGDRNLQNAFFRYILNSNDLVLSNQSYDDYIYSVIARPTTQNTTNSVVGVSTAATVGATQTKRYTLERTYMRSLNENIPRLDRMFKLFLTANNSSYDATLNQTIIKIPMSFNYLDIAKIQLITDSTWLNDVDGDRVYESVTPIQYLIKDKYIQLVFAGRFVPSTYATPPTRSVYIGIKFKMEVELSKQFVRDQNNNPIDGVLSLRTITTRHKKTGNYDIVVSNRGRTDVVSSFTNQDIDTLQSVLNLGNIEEDGEFMTNVLGFSDSLSIKIVSEYPTPCNIVNLEIKGKFIQKYSALTT